jgi:hypothetical protein
VAYGFVFERLADISPVIPHRIAAEVAAGLGLYFNKALGNNLLYRFERGQYQEHYKRLQGTGKAMSSVYGGEHLLRLFGTLSGRTLSSLPR